MGKVVYTTDVAHCMGRACPIRDKCYRYWLRKELCKRYVNKTLQSLEYPPHIEEQYDFETEQCEIFYGQ